ncbi:hypothetical protein AQUCO_00400135v1 [Aquilegia coerulea]|uniref:Uncharacterized protein n=1 Tax=Aquilegia coerulea TaxID=218851 RepID=A0A2G5ETU5_AQUCA|nr:hypothetical protein AQUCO_00400135v1 [Aquilegia coerulea]
MAVGIDGGVGKPMILEDQGLHTCVRHSLRDVFRKVLTFSIEAKVVSPEFAFYDSTKLSVDDSLHGEKLLRAKLALSFMYASKENDTWIRTLVKDLTVEAGSGIVILDPKVIPGGYTSLKDKPNISLTHSRVISLVLNLQNQVVAALQLGNACPLASCTNFNRISVSEKGNGPGYNLTFWRLQAPSNYVVLGDCVTSRPISASQAVMAVSNTYGRSVSSSLVYFLEFKHWKEMVDSLILTVIAVFGYVFHYLGALH